MCESADGVHSLLSDNFGGPALTPPSDRTTGFVRGAGTTDTMDACSPSSNRQSANSPDEWLSIDDAWQYHIGSRTFFHHGSRLFYKGPRQDTESGRFWFFDSISKRHLTACMSENEAQRIAVDVTTEFGGMRIRDEATAEPSAVQQALDAAVERMRSRPPPNTEMYPNLPCIQIDIQAPEDLPGCRIYFRFVTEDQPEYTATYSTYRLVFPPPVVTAERAHDPSNIYARDPEASLMMAMRRVLNSAADGSLMTSARTTRRGTSAFHGTIADFLRQPVLTAPADATGDNTESVASRDDNSNYHTQDADNDNSNNHGQHVDNSNVDNGASNDVYEDAQSEHAAEYEQSGNGDLSDSQVPPGTQQLYRFLRTYSHMDQLDCWRVALSLDFTQRCEKGVFWCLSKTTRVECIICHEALRDTADHSAVRTDCGHIFHFSCMRRWAYNCEYIPVSCPCCRQHVMKWNMIKWAKPRSKEQRKIDKLIKQRQRLHKATCPVCCRKAAPPVGKGEGLKIGLEFLGLESNETLVTKSPKPTPACSSGSSTCGEGPIEAQLAKEERKSPLCQNELRRSLVAALPSAFSTMASTKDGDGDEHMEKAFDDRQATCLGETKRRCTRASICSSIDAEGLDADPKKFLFLDDEGVELNILSSNIGKCPEPHDHYGTSAGDDSSPRSGAGDNDAGAGDGADNNDGDADGDDSLYTWVDALMEILATWKEGDELTVPPRIQKMVDGMCTAGLGVVDVSAAIVNVARMLTGTVEMVGAAIKPSANDACEPTTASTSANSTATSSPGSRIPNTTSSSSASASGANGNPPTQDANTSASANGQGDWRDRDPRTVRLNYNTCGDWVVQ